MNNLYDKIVDAQNFVQAYLDICEKFDIQCKSRYSGIDAIALKDVELNANSLLSTAQSELVNLKPLRPALSTSVPKKSGSSREIFIFSFIDRIKAQAVYRCILPIFENVYSKFLYSYRPGYSSYYAARSVARRYRKYWQDDFVLTADFTDYSNQIDHSILFEKLKKLDIDEKTLQLLSLFIKIKYLKNGKLISNSRGLVPGNPITPLMANLYLNDLDKQLGKMAQFYRRVGDDLILFDNDEKKIKNAAACIFNEAAALKLKIQNEKTIIGKAEIKFSYHGYVFENGIISLEKNYVSKIKSKISEQLKHKPKMNEIRKFNYLKNVLYLKNNSIHNLFLQIVRQKPLVNDEKQIKSLSMSLYRALTKFWFGSYTPRYQRLLKEKLKNLPVPSLHKYYIEVINGRKKISDITIPIKS